MRIDTKLVFSKSGQRLGNSSFIIDLCPPLLVKDPERLHRCGTMFFDCSFIFFHVKENEPKETAPVPLDPARRRCGRSLTFGHLCSCIPPCGAHYVHSADADKHKTFAPVTPEKLATRFTGQACGGKSSHRCANWPVLLCMKGRRVLPGPVAWTKRYCLWMSVAIIFF